MSEAVGVITGALCRVTRPGYTHVTPVSERVTEMGSVSDGPGMRCRSPSGATVRRPVAYRAHSGTRGARQEMDGDLLVCQISPCGIA